MREGKMYFLIFLSSLRRLEDNLVDVNEVFWNSTKFEDLIPSKKMRANKTVRLPCQLCADKKVSSPKNKFSKKTAFARKRNDDLFFFCSVIKRKGETAALIANQIHWMPFSPHTSSLHYPIHISEFFQMKNFLLCMKKKLRFLLSWPKWIAPVSIFRFW